MPSLPPFASRLNSFTSRPELFFKNADTKPNTLALLDRAATVRGLSAVDLNFPDHFAGHEPKVIKSKLDDLGLTLNSIAMRFYADKAFRAGAFTHPEAAIRQQAIDLTKQGIDLTRDLGCDLLTIWPGQDGYEHPFQINYDRVWEHEVHGIRTVAEHDADCLVAIEYKPNEPRSISVLQNVGTTLLAIREANAGNLGVTLDFGHVLYGDESPAFAASLAHRSSRLLGIQMNDGYGKRDDGLMTGSVHITQALELFRFIRSIGYQRAIYFDTFPDVSNLDPVAETEANIETVSTLYRALDRRRFGKDHRIWLVVPVCAPLVHRVRSTQFQAQRR